MTLSSNAAPFAPTSQMAELANAEALLEELRSASLEAGKRDLEEVKEFARLQV